MISKLFARVDGFKAVPITPNTTGLAAAKALARKHGAMVTLTHNSVRPDLSAHSGVLGRVTSQGFMFWDSRDLQVAWQQRLTGKRVTKYSLNFMRI